jgi:chromatin assembly factor 1 subunit B
MTNPAFMLPGIKTYATCVRFNPYIYEKKSTSPGQELLDLAYRMVFAVATTDQILIYATDSISPLAVIGNVHYAPINDLTWHYSNKRLLAGSTDGYISILSFANSPDSANIIGKRIPNEEIENEELREAISRSDLVDYKREEAKMQN